jgi:hypothetical protein
MLTRLFVLVLLIAAACSHPTDDESSDISEEPRLIFGSGEYAGWARWDHPAGLNASGTYVFGGGSVTVNDFSNGTYQATFQLLGSSASAAGNVHVNAIGNASTRCKVSSWTSSGTLVTANIRCHTAAGALTQSSWVVSYARFLGGTTYSLKGAYGHMNNTMGGLNASRTWGDTITASRTAVGRYTLTFATHTLADGDVQITAYGTNATHCNITSIATSVLTVGCYNQAGSPTDSQFTFRYMRDDADPVCPSGIYDTEIGNGGYVTFDGTTTPPASYNRTMAIDTCPPCSESIALNTIVLPGPGAPSNFYSVVYPGMGGATEQLPLTTAVANDGSYCHAVSWAGATNLSVGVLCFNPTGGAGNSLFSQLLFQNGGATCFW